MKKIAAVYFLLLGAYCFGQPKYEYWDVDKKQVKSEDNYKKGIAQGKSASWYQNGKLARLGWYKMGKQDSVWKFFYEDGNPKAIENYVFGRKQGHNQYYYKNGKLSAETVFKD